MTKNRIDKKFLTLKENNQKALIPFITAGDPDYKTSLDILKSLPNSGADLIELGMPFSDPMADGPTIQASSQRALKNNANMKSTLKMVKDFRENDKETPIILMGYYNPIYAYGTEKFVEDASKCGVDGLLIVDLPPEEEEELLTPCKKQAINLIHLATPTSDEARIRKITKNASGFIYYVSITGVTGNATPNLDEIEPSILKIRKESSLPIAIGFGIKTAKDVSNFAPIADAIVVGSSIVNTISKATNSNEAVTAVEKQVSQLSKALI
jgi:tryptophan synthase alpha chain